MRIRIQAGGEFPGPRIQPVVVRMDVNVHQPRRDQQARYVDDVLRPFSGDFFRNLGDPAVSDTDVTNAFDVIGGIDDATGLQQQIQPNILR